jgi:hypothetical protein
MVGTAFGVDPQASSKERCPLAAVVHVSGNVLRLLTEKTVSYIVKADESIRIDYDGIKCVLFTLGKNIVRLSRLWNNRSDYRPRLPIGML